MSLEGDAIKLGVAGHKFQRQKVSITLRALTVAELRVAQLVSFMRR
jgi:hypothetical protein